METSTVQAIKMVIIAATGLSKDALHVHIGLAIFFAAAFALRKPVKAFLPWLIVLVAMALGELLDMRDNISSLGYWRWPASLHDVVNTMFWPTLLLVFARLSRVFKPDVHNG